MAQRRFFDVTIESGGGPFTLDRLYSKSRNKNASYANTNASNYCGISGMTDLDPSTYSR